MVCDYAEFMRLVAAKFDVAAAVVGLGLVVFACSRVETDASLGESDAPVLDISPTARTGILENYRQPIGKRNVAVAVDQMKDPGFQKVGCDLTSIGSQPRINPELPKPTRSFFGLHASENWE